MKKMYTYKKIRKRNTCYLRSVLSRRKYTNEY